MDVVHTRDMAGWDGRSDFYEDDEPVDVLSAISSRGIDAITGEPASVVDVAEMILERIPATSVDTWKLQKLCYLVQAKHLGQTGLPAFKEPVEAWTHGPVIARLYQEHRGRFQVSTVQGDARLAEKDESVSRVVSEVLSEYADWSGKQLRELTHGQIPWLEARAGLGPTDRSRRVIAPGTMQEYFELVDSLPDDDYEDEPPF